MGELGEPLPARRGTSARVACTVIGVAAAALGATALALVGSGVLGTQPRPELLMAGLIGLIVVLTLGPAAASVVLWTASLSPRRLLGRLNDIEDALRVASEQSALSDDARRVLNRAAERELLVRAIEQDLGRGEYEAGLVLCRELADRFGYRAEAEQLRQRLLRERAASLDAALREALALIDGMLLQRRFDAGAAEAARLARLYPEEPRVAAARERVENARGAYKQELRRRFLDAANDQRIDEAMQLMRELDAYLTEAEAGPLREVARGVVGKARENLGALFKIAVEDADWATAVTLGRRIIADFPNSKMASEVRAVMDGLLARANSGAGGAVSPG